MTAIDWTATQKALGVTPDGIAGPGTWTAILRVVAAPGAKPDTVDRMARALAMFAAPIGELTRVRRIGNYVAQTANETGGFIAFSENLAYSAQRMAEVWPNRYAESRTPPYRPNAKALVLAGDVAAFANDVYGDRMGNQREEAGRNAGYAFRGAGPIHVTGYDNFLAAQKRTGLPFVKLPELMQDPAAGTIASLAFWKAAGVNAYLDNGDGRAARSITNAGHPNVAAPEGLPRVTQYESKLLALLK